MLFQHYEFYIFLAAFTSVFALTKGRSRLIFVFIASLFFYAWWYPPYTALIVAYVVMGWGGVKAVLYSRRLLPLVIIVCLLPLIFFKYTHFILGSIGGLIGVAFDLPTWSLPLGVSFVTFTIISLIVDAARNLPKGADNFLNISVFVTFFPHLLAGPIVRGREMIPQLDDLRINKAYVIPGLGLFCVGLIKKVLVADTLAGYVDGVFADTSQLLWGDAILGVLAFTVQIYCDFSGYSDMAIALAGFFGIIFPLNFRSPLHCPSMSQLWRNWHMTLSRWLTDYVFRPVFRKTGNYVPMFAPFVTMLVSGIWHGAAWTFVLWGALHGLIVVIESKTGWSKYANKSTGLLFMGFATFNFILFALSLVLFRSPSLEAAVDMYQALIGANGFGTTITGIWSVLLLCLSVLTLHGFDQREKIEKFTQKIPVLLMVPVCLVIVVSCAVLTAGRPESFYYFVF